MSTAPLSPHADPALTSVELTHLRGSLATYQPGATFGPRRMGDFEFVWLVEGQARYQLDGQWHDMPAGSVNLCRPGRVDGYEWDRKHTTRHAYFHFGFARYPQAWGDLDDWPVVRTLADNDAIRPLFRYVLDAWRQMPEAPQPQMASRIGRAVSLMLEMYILDRDEAQDVRRTDRPQAVQRVLDFAAQRLAAKPATPLMLEDLAEAAKTSPSHLCRLFRDSLGVTPMRAVRLIRLDMAMALLERTNMTVQEISYQCGFASPYHFSRVFSETFKRSPSQVRKSLRAGKPAPLSPLAAEVWSARQW